MIQVLIVGIFTLNTINLGANILPRLSINDLIRGCF